jgi:hypothetical protein
LNLNVKTDNMKKLLFLAMGLALTTQMILAQSWNLLIPPSAYDSTQLNFSPTAFSQNNSTIYSLYKNGTNSKIQKFDLNTNSVTTIQQSNQPSVNIGPFTYDFTNNRLVGNRAGRENLYSFSLSNGTWSQIGSGSSDSESYGAQFFWNPTSNKTAFFGGYGFYAVKNWIWENNGTWVNPYANNSLCNLSNPAKRNGGFALGAPGSNKLYLFSGQGSCDGNQSASSCNLGSPWATDVGVYCWLKDLWQLDLSNYSFTNILPVNSETITKEGIIVFDYLQNTFYIIGGFTPSPTYNSNFGNITDYEVGVLRYRVGIDSGFSNMTISGTPPPTVKSNNLGGSAAYFDGVNNKIIWARKDGIWGIDLNNINSNCQTLVINTGLLSFNPPTYNNTVTIYPNPANDQITIDCGNLTNVVGWNIKITNMLGQEVFNQPMNTQQHVVPLNSWSGQGMYFVKIINAQNEVVNIKKIILQ